MSLVSFYCDNCIFCNLSVLTLSKGLIHCKFNISNMPENMLKCHLKRCKQFFKKTWICQKTCVISSV